MKDEVVESTKIDKRGVRRVRFTIATYATSRYALVAAAEIAAIFAVTHPTSPISQKILPFSDYHWSYAYVRHPATRMLLANIGWFCGMAEGSWIRESDFAGFYAVFAILATMSKEDRALREKFGRKWT
ncbi:hypothetical protein CPB84DRAFT_1775699, partial [Gymnopilus junonius]